MAKLVRYKLDPKNPPRLSEETKRRLDAMTEEEIEANAAADPDNPPMTEHEADVFLAGVAHARRRGRPALPEEERKQNVTFRLAPDILEHFRATGPGWQNRVEAILRTTMKRERKRA